MGLVSTTLSGLYNGVSQQAPPIRTDTQAERQENIYSSLINGITKRPNTKFVAKLTSNDLSNAYIHTIDRDANEEYLVVFTGDPVEPIEIYTFEGVKCQVNYDSAEEAMLKDYLTKDDSGNPINAKVETKVTTVGDYTIAVNKTRKTEMDSFSETQTQMPDGKNIEGMSLVYIKKGYPETNYNVTIKKDGSTYKASYTTPAPSDTNVSYVKTDEVAANLKTALDSKLPSGFSVEQEGSIISVYNSDKDYTIDTSDSFGDTASRALKGSVQSLTKLPPSAPVGYVLRVENSSKTTLDEYYVKYVEDSKNGSGIWEETVALRDEDDYLMVNSFNADTLPKQIVRTSTNTFEVSNVEWADRLVGNDISSPYPSFVEQKINDVFFFQNRLGFLSGESVIMSRSGDYFNFFSATASDVLDTDPIDVTVSVKQVTILENAVPFAGTLLLFSKKVQFILGSGNSPLTPATVAIDPSTYFDTDTDVEPVGAGANIYFLVPYGNFSSIREYFVQENARTNDAANITAHVPSYLPQSIDRLSTSSARDMLIAIDSNTNELYVYKYFWNNQEKVQNAWSKWSFPEVDEILDAVLISSYLFLIVKRGTSIELLRMELEDKFSGDLPFRVYLDMLTKTTGTYSEQDKRTTFQLPYSMYSDSYTIVDSETGLSIAENIEQHSSSSVTVVGDFTDKPYYIGINYNSLYEFSKFYVRDDRGRPTLNGRMQIRSVTLTFTETASFKLISETNGERVTEKKYNGIVLGETKLGQPSFITGEEKFPVLSKTAQASVRIESDSYLPFRIHTASFEANYSPRSQHL